MTTQAPGQQQAPWQVYPRPQMRREGYQNLNGNWEFTVTQEDTLPRQYDRTITVPFCPESQLSGIGAHFSEGASLFYRRRFSLPQGDPEGRVLLHFGAVDQHARIYVNQQPVGSHTGGYEAFTLDITDYLQPENELVVQAVDDLRSHVLPYGKQSLNRGGMWYTPVSGIWQTVWLEQVPRQYIQKLDISADGQKAVITLTPALSGRVILDGRAYPLQEGRAELCPENPRLWSPEDPYLYSFSVETDQDRVESYFALRTLSVEEFDGIPRLCLNGKPYFFHGLLDQGYWHDGIFTPRREDGFRQDILKMKQLGFNTLRKHIKVEPEQFYYDCDRLGMIVFQDMVNNGPYSYMRDTVLPTLGLQKRDDRRMHRDRATRQAFLEGMAATVSQLKNHPCICLWTIFNEGWGQFDSHNAYRLLRSMDSSRFIDSTSGWFRRQQTDVESLHIYFGAWDKLRPCKKPLVLSEFGGYCYPEAGHLFNPEKSYGYKNCKSRQQLQQDLLTLYRQRVIPAVKAGLCAAIYTQVSDVEDEINGLMTYDRELCKVEPDQMRQISQALQAALPEGKEVSV